MSENSEYFNASTLIEPTNKERWNAFSIGNSPDAVDFENFDSKELMNNYSVMKTYQAVNMRVRKKLYMQAKSLNPRIIDHY